MPPGRTAVSNGMPVPGMSSVGVKVIGVADSVVAQVPAVKASEEAVGGDAHDNSHGGVEIINKHEDKVLPVTIHAELCSHDLMRAALIHISGPLSEGVEWSCAVSQQVHSSLNFHRPVFITRIFPAIFFHISIPAIAPSSAVRWAQ
jgi:hypothetical protein